MTEETFPFFNVFKRTIKFFEYWCFFLSVSGGDQSYLRRRPMFWTSISSRSLSFTSQSHLQRRLMSAVFVSFQFSVSPHLHDYCQRSRPHQWGDHDGNVDLVWPCRLWEGWEDGGNGEEAGGGLRHQQVTLGSWTGLWEQQQRSWQFRQWSRSRALNCQSRGRWFNPTYHRFET